jgi:predicted RNA-binding Zn ribbon-like protein
MAAEFEWVGGNLGLDFHNTVAWRAGVPSGEGRIPSYQDLLDWAWEANVLSESTRAALQDEAEQRPEAAKNALRWGESLRLAIHGVFSAVAQVGDQGAAQLDVFNGFLAEMPLRLRARSSGVGFGWDWSADPGDLKQVLWPIVWSTASLLSSDEGSHVKECPGDGCGWLFVDVSRRRNRKWCDMRECGNREKARRHYERHRKGLGNR